MQAAYILLTQVLKETCTKSTFLAATYILLFSSLEVEKIRIFLNLVFFNVTRSLNNCLQIMRK